MAEVEFESEEQARTLRAARLARRRGHRRRALSQREPRGEWAAQRSRIIPGAHTVFTSGPVSPAIHWEADEGDQRLDGLQASRGRAPRQRDQADGPRQGRQRARRAPGRDREHPGGGDPRGAQGHEEDPLGDSPGSRRARRRPLPAREPALPRHRPGAQRPSRRRGPGRDARVRWRSASAPPRTSVTPASGSASSRELEETARGRIPGAGDGDRRRRAHRRPRPGRDLAARGRRMGADRARDPSELPPGAKAPARGRGAGRATRPSTSGGSAPRTSGTSCG